MAFKEYYPNPTKSPFSREFYEDKINPETNNIYTIEEADKKRNSYRPIRPEYWRARGFSVDDAIQKATETKSNNDKKGAKIAGSRSPERIRQEAPRCKEYWMELGYKEEQAIFLVSRTQATFSLQTCIEKYGPKDGYERWQHRQDSWQNTLKSKTQEEIDKINRNKRSHTQSIETEFLTLYLCEMYYDKFDKTFYKIGITYKDVKERHEVFINEIGTLKILLEIELEKSIAESVENYMVFQNYDKIQQSHRFSGYTESFDPEKISKETLIEKIHDAINIKTNI